MDILDFENSTYSVNLRKLTKKSRLGFGYNSIKHITIQDILIMNKHKDLIKIYYGLGKINFTDDILDELGISQEMRIEKPGKIEDYEERDVMVNKALRAVKARKKAEHQAFKKMAEEMRKNEEKFDNQICYHHIFFWQIKRMIFERCPYSIRQRFLFQHSLYNFDHLYQ